MLLKKFILFSQPPHARTFGGKRILLKCCERYYLGKRVPHFRPLVKASQSCKMEDNDCTTNESDRKDHPKKVNGVS